MIKISYLVSNKLLVNYKLLKYFIVRKDLSR